jgi:anti-anti-sigma factor
MSIEVSTANGRVPVTIMHVSGNLDSYTYTDFQKKADELIKNGASHILVDLTNSPYVSTAGFRALHSMFNQLRALHPDANLTDEEVRKGISAGTYTSPHLKLLNLSPETQKAFEMTGFDMYIETFTDLQKAIASF